MSKNFSLNQCALLPAEVNPVIEDEFPMLAGVQSIDYYESILSPSISVQVKILDVDGNLSAKGVYGGEKLAIKIVAGKDSELEDFVITPEDHELILNSIKDITSGVKQQTATLQFVSKDLIKNEASKINKRYVGNITDSVKDILTKDPKGIKTTKSIDDVDRASNNYTFLGNRHNAFDIIQRLQPKAGGVGYDDKKKSDYGFLFFETFDGYHFRSLRSLFEPEPETEYVKSEISGTGDFVIDNYNFSSGNDVVLNLKSGLYNNETTFVELDKTKITKIKFNMDETEDLTLKPPKVPVNIEGKPSRIMLRVVDTGVHQHYEENSSKLKDVQPFTDLAVYQNKSYARFSLLNSQSLNITVGMNPALRAGQTIRVKFPTVDYKAEFGDDDSKDISGKYLISHLRHEFEGGKFRTHLRLIRDLFTPENA
tara:strand:- start:3417 stop:4691 length:1275 start_codon:yes stop_codon:yes gene_type:complete